MAPMAGPVSLLPSALRPLEPHIGPHADFAESARKAAEFFRNCEEALSPSDLLLLALEETPPKWAERFLFCLLDIGISDRQTATRAAQLLRLERLLARAETGGRISDPERKILEDWAGRGLPGRGGLPALRQAAAGVLHRLFAGAEGGRGESGNSDALALDARTASDFAFLLEAEARALKERIEFISENVDPYNMKTLARILPRLRVYDENVQEALELSRRLAKGEPVGKRLLTFEMEMREDGFKKWLGKIGKDERLSGLAEALALQRVKKLPRVDLVALSTLGRHVLEVDTRRKEETRPWQWILLSLRHYEDGRFAVPVGSGQEYLGRLLREGGARYEDGWVRGDFHLRPFTAWIGKDLLTRPFSRAAAEEGVDLKTLVSCNITRDSILEGLLNNAKVYQTPGMVAYIASMTRSTTILRKIATAKPLYTGYANREVPRFLLASPCNIPIALLRPFINTRFVSLMELKHLVKNKAALRREVVAEIETFLRSMT